MTTKSKAMRFFLFVLLLGVVASGIAFAGSAVIGSVAGSTNATVGGVALLPNTTLFSGDSIQVKDGVAVVAMDKASRMVFGHDTVASFLRDTQEVTVLLSEGNVSMFHPSDSVPVRVKVGGFSVAPVAGFKTLGEVAMLNGSVIVTAREGSLRVDGGGKTVNVARGQTITMGTKSARAPQGGSGGGGGGHLSGSEWLTLGAFGGSIAALIASILALEHSNDARDAANLAASNSADAAAAAAAAAEAAAAALAAEKALCVALTTPNVPAECL